MIMNWSIKVFWYFKSLGTSQEMIPEEELEELREKSRDLWKMGILHASGQLNYILFISTHPLQP